MDLQYETGTPPANQQNRHFALTFLASTMLRGIGELQNPVLPDIEVLAPQYTGNSWNACPQTPE